MVFLPCIFDPLGNCQNTNGEAVSINKIAAKIYKDWQHGKTAPERGNLKNGIMYTTDALKSKHIEYRAVKCKNPALWHQKVKEIEHAFYLQTLNKGILKDQWRDYWESNHPLIRDQKFFATEQCVDQYVKLNCLYNPTRTEFIKHPTIEIL